MNIGVLLIEDFAVVRAGVSQWLTRDPAIKVVGESGDGIDGLRQAVELRPDVILLDMHLPGMGGLMVLERLRVDVPEARVIVMSASEKSDVVLGALAAGAAGYITKRSTRQELCSAVITVFGGGSVIAPCVAVHLVEQYRKASGGEAAHLRSALSVREQEVLRLVAEGQTDHEIAKRIYISPRTVQNHLARVRDKTGLRRRSELTRWAVEHAVC